MADQLEKPIPVSSAVLIAIRITLIYALVALLWIFLSDRLLLVPGDVHTHVLYQTLKGGLFVLVTALLLYVLVRRALQQVRRNEDLLHRVVDNMPAGICLTDPLGTLQIVNPAARQIVEGGPLFGPEDQAPYLAWFADTGEPVAQDQWGLARALQGEPVVNEKITLAWPSGERKTVLHSAVPLVTAEGNSLGALIVLQDITDQLQMDEELRRFKFSIDQASEAVFWLNEDGRFLYVNNQACRSLGYSRQELLRMAVWEVDPDFPPERWTSHWQSMRKSDKRIFETRHRRKDGLIFPVQVSSNHMVLGGKEHHVAFVRDIIERKRYEAQLEHQATHDPLTGLPSRSLLGDRIQQALLYAERTQNIVAVLLLDLDRFKIVNESLGHNRGDELLQAAARRLTGLVRPGDTVGRLGVDEFVVALSAVDDADDIAMMARRIGETLRQPLDLGRRDVRIAASIGISLYPRDGDQWEDLLRKADIAMFRAKDEGGDNFRFFSPEMQRHVQETLDMETALRQGLEREEFVLHYQPKVEIASGRIIGCEALVRWIHPDLGLVCPDRFIPLAEETGVIIPLGNWVLEEACRQGAAWRQEGMEQLKISVNLSARQFLQPDLVALVQRALDASGLDSRHLELELTESMIMQDPEGAARMLKQLRDLGISLSLDDFGTGYSSLNYLRRFPVDNLKIDRSFITDVATDESAGAVAGSVVSIAHSLGMIAVAEGVESREQLDFLTNCRCDAMQGYLFSKPLAAEECAALLKSGRTLALD